MSTWKEISHNDYVVFQESTLDPKPPKAFRLVSSLNATAAKPFVVAEAKERAALEERLPELQENGQMLELIGLAKQKAIETLKNGSIIQGVREMLGSPLPTSVDKAVGSILYALASKIPASAARHRAAMGQLCFEKKLRAVNVDAVAKYLGYTGAKDLDMAKFSEECGIGVVVTAEDIAAAVDGVLAGIQGDLVAQRYAYDIMKVFKTVRGLPALKWADNKEVKDTFDAKILALLGPKTAADTAAAAAAKKKGGDDKKKGGAEDKSGKKEGTGNPKVKEHDHGLRLPMPAENRQQTEEILKQHLERTGGRLITRFPPEPNGFLHIGHAKSMYLNFGLAKKHGGMCYLRLDDTNPEKENQMFIDNIQENVRWLGHTPDKVTHASQYFDKLLECAVDLIKRGKAYVCHQTKEEISQYREQRKPSPWRDRPIEESLSLFTQMQQGRFEEGEATLRMKMDITSDNPCLWDLIAYRIRYIPHPVTGNKYCVYPSYDFTHCLNDSFEDIDLSLCTLEFLQRRVSYYWLVDALELYRPVVWEFSRLNITRTVMSKRKLLTLVTQHMVRGWDDPRLPTINGLRRRGYSAAAINNFCEAVGVTTNTTVFIDYTRLEQECRTDMEVRCNRAMAVFDPLLVELTNFDAARVDLIERRNHPVDEARGTNKVPLTRFLYINSSDFRLEDVKGYWGLAPGKAVGLRFACPITCTGVEKDADGKVTKILAEYNFEHNIKPKGYIHWVAQPKPGVEPAHAEIRLYEPLFMSERPDELKDWKDDLNPNSETIVDAIIDQTLVSAKPGDAFQFERVGFFCCDKDSTEERLVFNRTVPLKESKEKSKLN